MTIFDKLTQGLKFDHPRSVVMQTLAENFNKICCCPPRVNCERCFPGNYCNKCWEAWLASEYKDPLVIDL